MHYLGLFAILIIDHIYNDIHILDIVINLPEVFECLHFAQSTVKRIFLLLYYFHNYKQYNCTLLQKAKVLNFFSVTYASIGLHNTHTKKNILSFNL